MLVHMEAIILSMTKEERAKPEILNFSRKKRIAAGSGTNVEEINKIIKQFEQMKKLMKQFASSPKQTGRMFGRKMKMPF